MTTTHPELAAESAHEASPVERAELDAILGNRAVQPLFQPIVDLTTGEAVAFEALSRGPVGSPLQRPDLLFATAREAGCAADLDRLCRARALESVVQSNLQAPYTLFVNREPLAASLAPPSAEHRALVRDRGLGIVVEFTERSLSSDPATLLTFANRLRVAGLGVALDEVGVGADSLALLPFLMPDVIKLDMNLLHRRPDKTTVRVLSAVRAHAERRGTIILAEGIETPEHERLAVAMGATLGQGWLYGRPSDLPSAGTVPALPTPARPLVLRAPEEELALASPFEIVTEHHPALRAPADLLVALRQQLEHGMEALPGVAVVLRTGIDAPTIYWECAEHNTGLAEHARFAAAFGSGMPSELVPGLHGSRLAGEDLVSSEWDLVVVGPHFAGAVVARERFDPYPEEGRAFDYVLTYERNLVIDVARTLMMRALPLEGRNPEIEAVLTADGPVAL